ncbi:MAG: TlpA disulfide reductase family protein [Bacteroidota bacterium]
MGLQGLSPTIDSLYQEYRQVYPSSPYASALADYYQDWQRIGPGQPAPEIIGLNLRGDTISLSDLRGKLIYVDVWASWCRPCVAEFPYYEELQNALNEEERIEFLFVSIDQERSDWENVLLGKTPPQGLHINDLKESEDYGGITSIYNMWGIPQYLIIDQAGNIVDTKAPPPSSAKIKEVLTRLL